MAPLAKRRPPASLKVDLPVVLAALTGGLLSSSCCVVQLALNSMSLGCAGLSVFKPYRFLLRPATAALLGLMLLRNGVNHRTLGTVVASLLLTASEDALTAVNRAGSVRALLRRAGAGKAAAAPPADAPAVVRWRVDVRGMRCQACAARVRGSVAALPGVRNATVLLQEGRVEVWADAAAPVTGDEIKGAIAALDPEYAVDLAGLECYGRDDRRAACGELQLVRLGGDAADAAAEGAAAEGAADAAAADAAAADLAAAAQQTQRRRPGAAGADDASCAEEL